MDAQ
jgi:hypothetical protein